MTRRDREHPQPQHLLDRVIDAIGIAAILHAGREPRRDPQPPLKLKDWALAIAKRSTMRKARIALVRRLAVIMHARLGHGTQFNAA